MHTAMIALLCAVLNLACTPKPIPPPVPPQPRDMDASGVTIADVCQHLGEMDCAAGKTTAGGHTCLEVLRNVQDSGIIALNLPCLFTATTCADADLCH
jgi:hypothetical protein